MTEEKDFMTLDEVAKILGVTRATIYNYMGDLNIKTHRRGRDKRAYLALADVETMKDYRENPWKYPRPEQGKEGDNKPERPAA